MKYTLTMGAVAIAMTMGLAANVVADGKDHGKPGHEHREDGHGHDDHHDKAKSKDTKEASVVDKKPSGSDCKTMEGAASSSDQAKCLTERK